jgi:hypothetical protein
LNIENINDLYFGSLHNSVKCQNCNYLIKDSVLGIWSCKHICELKEIWLANIDIRIKNRKILSYDESIDRSSDKTKIEDFDE